MTNLTFFLRKEYDKYAKTNILFLYIIKKINGKIIERTKYSNKFYNFKIRKIKFNKKANVFNIQIKSKSDNKLLKMINCTKEKLDPISLKEKIF